MPNYRSATKVILSTTLALGATFGVGDEMRDFASRAMSNLLAATDQILDSVGSEMAEVAFRFNWEPAADSPTDEPEGGEQNMQGRETADAMRPASPAENPAGEGADAQPDPGAQSRYFGPWTWLGPAFPALHLSDSSDPSSSSGEPGQDGASPGLGPDSVGMFLLGWGE